MRLPGLVLLLSSLIAMSSFAQPLHYPTARKSGQVDDYHGTKVADPYRWLEDTDSPETLQWIAAENQLTHQYLGAIPARARFKDRLTTLYNYERFAAFQKLGNRYLYLRNDGLQNQDVMYVADSLQGPGRVLLDPNTLRADGTAALGDFVASPDGSLVAWALADAGSDWLEWRVRDTATGKDLPDTVRFSKFEHAAWSPDKKGFYYLRFPEPKAGESLRDANVNSKLYLHTLGEPQSSDRLIYERPDQPHWMFNPTVSADGRYLIISIETTDFGRNLLAYQDLTAPQARPVELITEPSGAFNVLGNQGAVLYCYSTDHAPNGRVVAIDLARPKPAGWRVIVPERKEAISGAAMAGGKVIVQYVKDAADQLELFALDGTGARDVALPPFGQVQLFASHQGDKEIFFGYTGFTMPRVIYRIDLATGRAAPVRQPKVSFDLSQFQTEQVFYNSKDGTRIPMFVVHRKGLKLDGQNPTLLYAYGGFNVSVPPDFKNWQIAWLEAGGVYASANLRGGAEYGDAWHEAGKREKKHNVFDDFIAAAEYLIAHKYTSTPKLAIYGGSNGGLLIGAVLNQRPELFGAAMPAVGVMDMLRFQKFTIGAAWVDEYGSSDNAADFQTLYRYSPLHNIRPGAHYPPVLITTADHDDRVVPGHSFKYAATLQAAQAVAAPVLIRIETRAGHGAGKPVTKIIDEYADRLAFLSKELGMK